MLRVNLVRLRNAIDVMELQRQRQLRLLQELRERTQLLFRSIESEERMEEQGDALHRQLDELDLLVEQHLQLLRTITLAERRYTWAAKKVERQCERSALTHAPARELKCISLKQLRLNMENIQFLRGESYGGGENHHTD